jgi:hypothetical protein
MCGFRALVFHKSLFSTDYLLHKWLLKLQKSFKKMLVFESCVTYCCFLFSKKDVKMKEKEVRDIRRLNYSPVFNPFIEMRSPIQTKSSLVTTKMSSSLVGLDTNEVHENALIHTLKEIDGEHFVKVFSLNVVKAFELNKTERRVFDEVLKVYSKEVLSVDCADTIYLSFFDNGLNGQTINMSNVTFNRGLKGLLNKGFLSPKTPNTYWVNPSLFFKGDRVRFITEYKLEKIKRRGDAHLQEKLPI